MYKIFFLFVAIFLINACKSFCVCEPEPPGGISFVVLNKNGQDLLFGAQARYKPDSVKILIKDQAGNFTAGAYSIYSFDNSAVRAYLNDSQKYYLYLSASEPLDSIEAEWKPVTEKCCGDKYQTRILRSLKFNGKVTEPLNGTYQLIR